MTPRESEQTRAALHADLTPLLVDRLWASLWLILAGNVVFAVAIGILDRPNIPALYAVKLFQLVVLGAVAALLRRPVTWERALTIALVHVAVIYFTTALSGVITKGVASAPLVFIMLSMGTATLFPWGFRPQLATVAFALLSLLWVAHAAGGIVATFDYSIASCLAAFPASLYIAYEFERYRTQRRAAEDALLERVRLESLRAEAALDCIVTMDHEGRIVEFNPAAEHTFGYARGAVLGRAMDELIIPPALRDAHRRGLQRYLATGEGPMVGKRIEITAMRADGREFPIELAITRIPRDGPPLFTGFLRDITERKRAEEALTLSKARLEDEARANARLVEELERAGRLKSEFVSTMSHELRTPLNVILGYAEMLEDEPLDARRQRQLITRIKTSGQELLELVENTLEIGRINVGLPDVRLEPVFLPEFWATLREGCARMPRRAEVGLEWGDAMPVMLRTDPRKLTVMIRNLVGNALKFTERGGVRVAAEMRGETVVLCVSDTGVGIRSEDQETVFELFRQADGSDARRFGGAGLGLYIVRRFAQQLGGRVDLESAPGLGSTFRITLPNAAASQADIAAS